MRALAALHAEMAGKIPMRSIFSFKVLHVPCADRSDSFLDLILEAADAMPQCAVGVLLVADRAGQSQDHPVSERRLRWSNKELQFLLILVLRASFVGEVR